MCTVRGVFGSPLSCAVFSFVGSTGRVTRSSTASTSLGLDCGYMEAGMARDVSRHQDPTVASSLITLGGPQVRLRV
jgi:hypothetical protein